MPNRIDARSPRRNDRQAAKPASPDASRRRSLARRALAIAALALLLPEAVQSYVGPGAGFALVGSLLAVFFAFLTAVLSLLIWPFRFLIRAMRRRKASGRSDVRRLIVLGFDGLDPQLVEQWIAEGHLPHLAALARQGSFSRLQTTYPSISPVAWSSFMTGVDPARHNIFDFLSRDLRTYKPRLSSSQVSGAARTIRIGEWVIPVGKPAVSNMRKSRAFWSILGDHGVPSNILRVPLTFPPEKFAGVLLSAMCVPDLRGTQGSFTFYTTDPAAAGGTEQAPETTGGERRLVSIEDGVIRTHLSGPENTMRRDGRAVQLPFSIRLERDACVLEIAGQRHRLKEKEYSPWIRLPFRPATGFKVYGIARFYVTQLQPHFGLYVTPINIDPGRPALPISWPTIYSIYLSKLIGEFATLGLAEDTWALNERVIDEEAFLKQTLDHHEEREKMFFNAVRKSTRGVIACVFDGTDRLQHMFFRYLDEDHPANRGKDIVRFKHTIRDMYQRADDLVGRIMKELGPKDALFVISDHGFQTFRRGVNLNTWLMQQGLLHLTDGATRSGDWFEKVDWSRTQAYAFGLAGLYVNQKGREARGIVAPGEETRALKHRIAASLSGLTDEERDAVAINEVFDSEQIHSSGPYRNNGPDLIVGYNRGYRASWEGAVGRITDAIITDNTKSWSGDHCIDPRLVPGVLFSNWRIAAQQPGIADLAPTILRLFGVDVPDHMTGKPLDVERPREAVA